MLAVPVVVVSVALVLGPGLALWRKPSDAAGSSYERDVQVPSEATVVSERAAPDAAALSESAEFVAPRYALASTNAAASGGDGSPFDCIIEPSQVLELGSAVIGVIDKLHVERGGDVEAGQVVAELESGTESAAVELARSRAQMTGEVRSRQASAELGNQRRERARELFDHEAMSLDVRQKFETEAELAELELTRAKEQQELARLELKRAIEALKRRSVVSPISGVVVERMLSPGEVVDEEPILRIAQLDPLRVEVILPSALFGSIRKGMWGAVMPEVPGDRVHAALVTIVDRVVDSASGTFGVQLELRNPKRKIAGGLHCRVTFLRE